MALTWKNDLAARLGLARFASVSHWASAQCKAWWIALPGLVGGRQWYDVHGQYPWTISYATYSGSGIFQRPSGYWSPTFENGDYQYNPADSFSARPGALSGTFLGPLVWYYGNGGSLQQAYGTCNASINTLCPKAGTLALWLRPTQPIATTSVRYTLIQGNSISGNGVFQVAEYNSSIYTGFYTGSDYRPVWAPGGLWSTTTWLHLVMTWAANDYVRLYANGVLAATSPNPLPSTLPQPATNLALNADVYGANGNGLNWFSSNCVDDLCIWAYQMPAALVKQVYRQSSLGWPGRLEARPPLLWRPSGSAIIAGTGGISLGGDPQTIPAQIAMDTFTDTAGTELSQHKPDSGGAWSEASGYTTQAFITSASRLRQDSNNVGQTVYYHSATFPSANYTVTADVFSLSRTLSQTAAGVVARYDASSGSFYAASYNHHAYEWELLKYQNGSFTTLGTYAQSINTGQTYTVQLSVSGVSPTYLRLSVGGVVLISVTDSTSPITIAGKAGVLFVNLQAPGLTDTTGDHLDNFVARTTLVQVFAGYGSPAAGGTRQGGSRIATVQFSPAPGGGTNLGGVGAAGHTFVCLAAGGIPLGGKTSGKSIYRMTPGGGVTVGGVASLFQGHTYTVMPSGGFSYGGHNTPQTGFTIHAFGGYRQGGLAAPTSSVFAASSGGMSLSGSTAWRGVAYHVYANSGVGEPINYSTAIAVVSNLSWTSKALTYPGDWKFGVRAFEQATNLEEENVDAVVEIMLDAAGADASLVPPAPLGLSVLALAGGSIRVLWSCPCSDQDRLPTGFHVYLGAGTSPNYSSPVTTIPASDGRMGTFSAVVSNLTDGTQYAVSVRSFNSVGEEANTDIATIMVDGSPPEVVDGLFAVATNQD